MDPDALERRLDDVFSRWERRLEAAVAEWERLAAEERSRRARELDEAGETDEWLRLIWSWWLDSPGPEQDRLVADVRFMAPVLRAARHQGLLDAADAADAAAGHLLGALERLEGIFRVEPPGGSHRE